MVSSIFFYPIEGKLDVATIDQYLTQQADVLLDPLGSGIYMLCGLPNVEEIKEAIRKERLASSPDFPYSALVTVAPHELNVFQEYADDGQLRSARNFVRWLYPQGHYRIEDGYGTDWTARVAEHGVDVLYPETLT